jgi:hypothetical protein
MHSTAMVTKKVWYEPSTWLLGVYTESMSALASWQWILHFRENPWNTEEMNKH